MYIDDMNYGDLPDWGEIYANIEGDSRIESPTKRRKGLAKLFG